MLFAGKAAPASRLAKVIIKLITSIGRVINADPAVRGKLRVEFLPNYSCTLAEYLIPAADVSEQISTAGYEASGTSNMKFMMNGALTVGTRDGANIEIAEEAGEENAFMFGLTTDQVLSSRGWYDPRWHYENEPETRAALDMIFGDYFSADEPGLFEPIRETLLTKGDYYMHLADLTSYVQAQQVSKEYCRPRRLGSESDHQRGPFGQILQRPHDCRVCRGDLECEAHCGGLSERRVSWKFPRFAAEPTVAVKEITLAANRRGRTWNNSMSKALSNFCVRAGCSIQHGGAVSWVAVLPLVAMQKIPTFDFDFPTGGHILPVAVPGAGFRGSERRFNSLSARSIAPNSQWLGHAYSRRRQRYKKHSSIEHLKLFARGGELNPLA